MSLRLSEAFVEIVLVGEGTGFAIHPGSLEWRIDPISFNFLVSRMLPSLSHSDHTLSGLSASKLGLASATQWAVGGRVSEVWILDRVQSPDLLALSPSMMILKEILTIHHFFANFYFILFLRVGKF